jgi:hypothetical protein
MVTIRRLSPSVGRIALPAREHASNLLRVERRRADFPPPSPQSTPCVLWQGSVDKAGYGRMKRVVNGEWETVKVHRWVVEQLLGRRLGRFEVVMHACDNPPCFRLDHLAVGSIVDNNRDMFDKGRASPPPVNRFTGAEHPMARFKPHEVQRVRRDYRTGVSAKTLAAEWGCDIRTIRKLVEGVTYADTSTRDLLAEARARLEAPKRLRIPREVTGSDRSEEA